MNEVKSKVFDRLRSAAYTEDARAVAAMIRPADVEPLAGTPRLVPVSELHDIWSFRLGNTEITGAFIEGAKSFLPRLRGFDPAKRLEQFSFMGADGGGNVYFEPGSGAFVGYVFCLASANPVAAKARAAAWAV
jgi:hypothetical protein